MCRVVRVTKWRVLVQVIRFISTSVNNSLNYSQYSDIADLNTLQFNVAHALGSSVFTSRLLGTDFNTETITSKHSEVLLPFLVQSLWYSAELCWTQNWTSVALSYRELTWMEMHLKLKNVQANVSHIATDDQWVSKSWCRAPSGVHDQIFITLWQ
jgi:hypothetical protein